jgi:hypothetical protein
MTTKELIARLQLCHPDSEVNLAFYDYDDTGEQIGYSWNEVAEVDAGFEKTVEENTPALVLLKAGEQVGCGETYTKGTN